jgi:hypothetical protein
MLVCMDPSSPPVMRTFHLLKTPDILCANDTVKTLSNYVDNELQGEGSVQLVPQGPGHSSVGVRINLKDHFKGAILEARFTRRALATGEFLKMPPSH